jgi:Rpp20 subunit of nuclear RNase MRP and P
VVKAMGAAIEKAVCLALELQRRKYSVGIITGTVEVIDDVIPQDNVLRIWARFI